MNFFSLKKSRRNGAAKIQMFFFYKQIILKLFSKKKFEAKLSSFYSKHLPTFLIFKNFRSENNPSCFAKRVQIYNRFIEPTKLFASFFYFF